MFPLFRTYLSIWHFYALPYEQIYSTENSEESFLMSQSVNNADFPLREWQLDLVLPIALDDGLVDFPLRQLVISQLHPEPD
jgi:hypothetical protein